MQELNRLAARVWKRLATGEAYVKPKPKRPQQKAQIFNPLGILLLLWLIIDN